MMETMKNVKVRKHVGVSKKTEKEFTALVLLLEDEDGTLWESDFVFPRWHRLDAAGSRVSERPNL